jgi:hypothetical protein
MLDIISKNKLSGKYEINYSKFIYLSLSAQAYYEEKAKRLNELNELPRLVMREAFIEKLREDIKLGKIILNESARRNKS